MPPITEMSSLQTDLINALALIYEIDAAYTENSSLSVEKMIQERERIISDVFNKHDIQIPYIELSTDDFKRLTDEAL